MAIINGRIIGATTKTGTKYHDRYASEAETRLNSVTTTTEIYYTARPDGDGYAENEVDDAGETDAIIRTIYFSTKFNADPNDESEWVRYTIQPIADSSFELAKEILLNGLKDTDGTANTRGTLPVSIKMERVVTPPLLVDTYGGEAIVGAYSVRKIGSVYNGPCMRVREDGTNTETDINFNSEGHVNVGEIIAHCGSSNGYVSKWYDQSGKENHITQPTTSLQLLVYNGSSVIKDNNRTAIYHPGGTSRLDTGVTLISGTQPRSMYLVANPDFAGNARILSLDGGAGGVGDKWGVTSEVGVRVNGFAKWPNNPWNSQTMGMLTFPSGGDTSNIDYYENGNLITSKSVQNLGPINTLGQGNHTIASTNGYYQEVLLWRSDEDASVSGIYSDVDSYYRPDTKLIADAYSAPIGLSGAFSVRKVSQWYNGSCMRIRETSGGTEVDIGFDSNGDLDTAAIASHCGSANGTVVTWYDQSGNGNDASQRQFLGQQPLIYDGATQSVLVENNRPILVRDTPYGYLETSGVLTPGPGAKAMFCVGYSANPDSDNRLYRAAWFGGTGPGGSWNWTTEPAVRVDGNIIFDNDYPIDRQMVASLTFPGNSTVDDIEHYQNGSGIPTQSSTGTTVDTITGSRSAVGRGSIRMQELLLYTSDQALVRSRVETDIESYYKTTTSRFLDQYQFDGALAAYSLRELRQWYDGPCIRVVRDSDDAELDIGFVNGELDTDAIIAHCGAATGTVTTWYDQSGNGLHQFSTPGRRPLIYDGSAINLENGKPAMSFGGTGQRFDGALVANTTGQPYTVFTVSNPEEENDTIVVGWQQYSFVGRYANNEFSAFAGEYIGKPGEFSNIAYSGISSSGQLVTYSLFNQESSVLDINGQRITGDVGDRVLEGNPGQLSGLLRVACDANGNSNFNGNLQEVVFFVGDKSSNDFAMTKNINDHYKGEYVLDVHGGAAGAYSLRKLSSAYSGAAIRVRETGSDTEQDIGFNFKGELNTDALAAFCGANSGVVTTWYDQSGNGRDGTEATFSEQPVIYDGTAVITKNNKPAIQFDGISHLITFDSTVKPSGIDNCSAFTVQTNRGGLGLTLGTSDNAVRWYQSYSHPDGNEYFGYQNGGSKAILLGTIADTQKLITAIAGSTQGDVQAFLNGTNKGSQSLFLGSPPADNNQRIGYPVAGLRFTGEFQEAIIYHEDKSPSRESIEYYINDYYKTY